MSHHREHPTEHPSARAFDACAASAVAAIIVHGP